MQVPGAPARPQLPQPLGPYYDALRLANAMFQGGPRRDPVAAGYFPTSDLFTLTLQEGVPGGMSCGESALRLAVQFSGVNVLDFPDIHVPGGVTLGAMRRRLSARRIAKFPVYVVMPLSIADERAGMGPEESVYVLVGGERRDDGYAIVYIPSDPVPARNFPEAHWAFAIVPVPQPVQQLAPQPALRNPVDMLVFTKAPLRVAEHVGDIHWRAQIHPAAALEYTQAGVSVCCCPLDEECDHERRFLCDHANAKIVSFLDDCVVRLPGRQTERVQMTVQGAVHRGTRARSILRTRSGGEVVVMNGHSTPLTIDPFKCLPAFTLMSFTCPSERGLLGKFQSWTRNRAHFYHPLQRTEVTHMAQYEVDGWTIQGTTITEKLTGVLMALVGTSISVVTSYFATKIIRRPLTQLFRDVAVKLWMMSSAGFRGVCIRAFQHSRALRAVGFYVFGVTDLLRAAGVSDRTLSLMGSHTSFSRGVMLDISNKMDEAHIQSERRATALLVGVKQGVDRLKLALRPSERTVESVVEGVLSSYQKRAPKFSLMQAIQLGSGLLLLGLGCYMAVQGWRIYRACERWGRMMPLIPVQQEYARNHLEDLNIDLPRRDELLSRIAAMVDKADREHVLDIVKRLCAEERWNVNFTNFHEFETFLERVVVEPGLRRMCDDKPSTGCVNCRGKVWKHQLCRPCIRLMLQRRPDPVLSEQLVTKVGIIGLWSTEFDFPEYKLKPTAQVVRRRTEKTLFNFRSEPKQIRDWYKRQHVQVSCRGRNNGPIFLGQAPRCFPRGEETAVIAFLVRLGCVCGTKPNRKWFTVLERFVKQRRYPEIHPETRDDFLSHFKSQKLQKMLEAEASVNQGNNDGTLGGSCVMAGFTKAEKSYDFTLDYYCDQEPKQELKPRFICCPAPEFLYLIGPYTHAQTKWLSKNNGPTQRAFYAGCATPGDMTTWLRLTLSDMGSFITYADDISACDASHSKESMEFHRRMREHDFRGLPANIAALFDAEEKLRIRVGNYRCTVQGVNGSGVSDTSFKNSYLCLFVRIIAIAHAVRDLTTIPEGSLDEFLKAVADVIWTSASGDDGLTRLGRWIFGTDMLSEEAQARYLDAWSWFGFKVKLHVYCESDWRNATYLACRPTHTVEGYVWTPEIARRLRGLFWMIDCPMNPNAWARGVALSLSKIAGCNPVLGPLARWYLDNTSGPVVQDLRIFGNPDSVWNSQTTTSEVTAQAVEELVKDVRASKTDYETYLYVLKTTPSVYIDINTHLLRQVFRYES